MSLGLRLFEAPFCTLARNITKTNHQHLPAPLQSQLQPSTRKKKTTPSPKIIHLFQTSAPLHTANMLNRDLPRKAEKDINGGQGGGRREDPNQN